MTEDKSIHRSAKTDKSEMNSPSKIANSGSMSKLSPSRKPLFDTEEEVK